MRKKANNKSLIKKILIIVLIVLLSFVVARSIKFSEVLTLAGIKDNFKTETVSNGKTGKLTEIIEGSDYGKTINYSVEVNGKTYNQWKVLYNDGNTVQIIMSDFLPQEGIPNEALAAGLEKVRGEQYSVYSSQYSDKLLAGLRTGWSDFARGVSGATATGAPTKETVEASFQGKYGTSWDTTTAQSDTLYVSHLSSVDGCGGYWLATHNFAMYVYSLRQGRIDGYCGYNTLDNGVRPVVFLPSDIIGTVGDETITLKPEKVIINVTWYNQDELILTKQIEEGEDYTKFNPETPSKEGYEFIGWEEKEIDDAGNIKIIAKWQKKVDETSKLYTITIDNEKEGHTYNSYQVFKGDYYEKEEIILDENNEEKVVKVPILSNIVWGAELQKEVGNGKTHGDKILEALKTQNSNLYNDCKTAEDVARVLQGKPNDGEVIKEFTNVVGKYILDNKIKMTKGTSTLVDQTDKDGNLIDTNYKITNLEPGYYIVIDAEVKEKDDAYSRYLIDVVQDVTMYPKTSIPRLNKKVGQNNLKTLVNGTYVEDEKRNTATYKKESETYNASDYDIEFELKSYIPDVTGYNTYKFEVVDILAKGFDYDRNSLKVMLGQSLYPQTRTNESGEIVNNYTISDVVIDASNYETYKNYFEEEGKTYPENFAESNYGKILILVELNDLVEQVNDGIVEKGQDIFVRYNSKLNGKGEVGTIPNINEAYIKYSNDPYHNDKTSQTTTQTTYTYTIDLNLIKIAELKDEISILNYLEGAEFEIYNKPETDKDRNLIATIKTDEILDSEGNIINKAGQALYSSLGVGTYYIKETKSPEGYNKLRQEIEIEVKATCDEYGTITWTVKNAENNLVLAQIGVKEETEIPEIKLQIENTSGLQLPVTGGTGTAIFTVIGLSTMVFAIIFFKENKNK